jgi:hypothetical protein
MDKVATDIERVQKDVTDVYPISKKITKGFVRISAVESAAPDEMQSS